MLYIRKIKEESWFFEKEALDSDSISDLSTTNHELSVWQIENDRSNLDNIVLALALTRNETRGIYVAIINNEDLKTEYNWDITIMDEESDTAYNEMRNEHKNFILSSFWDLGFLAEHIHNLIQDEAKYLYYDEPKLISLLSKAITEGKISLEDLKSHKKTKWIAAYNKQ